MAATKRKMNFTNVKDSGQFSPRHVPEGDYVMKVVKVDDHTSKEGNEQWLFTIQRKGDQRANYPYYCGCDEKQAWKIRKLFIAAGIQVPKKLVLVDPNKLVGKEIGAFLEDDEYEGRMRSRIADTFPVADVSEADEDDHPKRKSRVVKEDDDEVDTSDVDDDEEDDEEPGPPPRRKRVAPALAKKRRPEPEPEDEDDDLDELDVEEI